VEKAVNISHAIVVESDCFSLELNADTADNEQEIVIDNDEFAMSAATVDQFEVTALEPVSADGLEDQDKSLSLVTGDSGLTAVNQDSPLSEAAARLQSADAAARCEALMDLSQLGGEEAFDLIAGMFDDASVQVRNAAARALCDLNADRAASLTRALREAQPERRRRIGAAFAGSGLASQAINCLAGESREVTYDAFTILFLMAKAGEVQPLIETIENHANVAVRLAVIKLLAFSNQAEVVAAFRRLAVRASLPAEVRSAVMEAIHDIGTSRQTRISAA
jgi:HEAT repeat protein